MDITHPKASLEICVSQCPNKTLLTLQDIASYATETGVLLCNYGVAVDEYTSQEQGLTGPCPHVVMDRWV